MSKIALKKELANLTREQLTEVILTAYSANKVIKDYFDFFANPDVDKLYDRFIREVLQEVMRGKRKRSTARISRIRKSIKDFEGFNPGVEKIRDLRLKIVEMLVENEMSKEYSDTLIFGTLKLLNDTIAFSDKNLIFDSTMKMVEDITRERNDRSKYFRKFLKKNIVFPDA